MEGNRNYNDNMEEEEEDNDDISEIQTIDLGENEIANSNSDENENMDVDINGEDVNEDQGEAVNDQKTLDGNDEMSEEDGEDNLNDEELSSDDEDRVASIGNAENMKVSDILKIKTPKEVFEMFDDDNSGEIDEEEFLQALPKLKITISKARALKYFRIMDLDGSGAIGFDEL